MTKTMSPELTALCAQLHHWRQQEGGGRGKRVPAALWRRAATVARTDGAYRTARAKRLKYDRLRMLLAEEAAQSGRSARSKPASARVPSPSAAQFVAVQMKPATHAPSLTIEIVRRSGERIRIESAGAVDLASIVLALRNRP